MHIVIPWRDLSAQALDELLAEIVTRDGTDYGETELETSQKVSQAKRALEQGRAEIRWDSHAESATLVERK